MKLVVDVVQVREDEDESIDDLSWADDELQADIKHIVIDALNANGYLADIEAVL